MIQENWRPVLGYEGHYKVSDLGRVLSIKFGKEKILKQSIVQGYCKVSLVLNGERKIKTVSRIVYESFKGKTDFDIDHINENKSDNRLCNLQEITERENLKKNYIFNSTKEKTHSKFIGVTLMTTRKGTKRWVAQGVKNGIKKNLGSYGSEQEAHNAYLNYINY